MSFSSKPKDLATLGVYRKLVHILEVYHKKEVVRNCEKQIKNGVLMINTSRGEIIDTNALIEGIENE
ncbi:NAD(P)-dependent oxidoreductase [Holdemanella biformis]|uniref:NAD(P)-dependent oxidoreductase n=1 Tax=Holdemanella biformis TaxID=1735 RepID=UPI00402A3FA2